MLKKLLSVCALLLLSSITIYAGQDDLVLGKAGIYVVKKSDLDRLIGYYSPDRQKYLQENPQQKITLVKRMLEVKLLSDIARKDGFDRRADVKEQLEFLVNDYLSREYIDKVVSKNVTVTEEDIKQYYTVNKDKFSVPEEVRARHILMKVSPNATEAEKENARKKAADILERVKKGEDFAKLAEEFSEDKGSKADRGDLGYFPRGRMVKSFEDAAFSLKPGEVSGIVETKFGYHIIKVEDRREAKIRPLDEVRDSISEQLKNDIGKSKALEFIDKTKKDAGLTIYVDKVVEGVQK